MRTFYKKLPLFIKHSILHTYKKLKPQIWAFIKNSIFGNNRDPCVENLGLDAWRLTTFFKVLRICQGLSTSFSPWSTPVHKKYLKSSKVRKLYLALSLVDLDPFSPLPLCLPTSRASFLLLMQVLLIRNRDVTNSKCNPPQSTVLQGLSCLIFALTPIQGAKVLQGGGHSGGVHLCRPVPALILSCVERQVVLGVRLVLLPVLGDL